jgi:hypothetical protein
MLNHLKVNMGFFAWAQIQRPTMLFAGGEKNKNYIASWPLATPRKNVYRTYVAMDQI